MIFPIVAYGHPTLRKKAEPVNADTPGLQEFIKDLWETMYATDGIGLAAPQVNRSIRVFVIDTERIVRKNFPKQRVLKRLSLILSFLKKSVTNGLTAKAA